jgi:hypothetical protein
MTEEEKNFAEALAETPTLGAKIAWALASLKLVKLDETLWPEGNFWPSKDWRFHLDRVEIDMPAIRKALDNGTLRRARGIGAASLLLLEELVGTTRPVGIGSRLQIKKQALSSSRFARLRMSRGLPFKSKRQPV